MIWQKSSKSDSQVIELVDRHYHRRPGSIGKQVGPPGRVLVLKTFGAEWITHWPFLEYADHRWAGMWICASFRKETPCQLLASDMVRDAVAATRWFTLYGDNPIWYSSDEPIVYALEARISASMVTFVDPSKVSRRHKYRKTDYGRCFTEAGFVPDGKSESGLLAFVLPCVNLPEPKAPLPEKYLNKIAREALSRR